MTAKEFFKSTAFKCIAVLLSILLVCGILLTICNSLFYVSDQERFERAINKIYGKSVETESVLKDTDNKEYDTSSVLEAYKVKDDGNYLIKVTGKEGFEGGTVTCWIVVEMAEGGKAVKGVGKVKIDSSKSQSYIGNIDDNELAQFSKLTYTDGFVYELGKDGKDYIATGASISMVAISNAVNGAINYVNLNVLGKAAAADPFEGFEFVSNKLNKDKTTYEIVDGSVKFNVRTRGNGNSGACVATITVDGEGKITSYELTTNGGTDDTAGNGNTYHDNLENLNVSELLKGKTKADILAIIGTTDGSYDNALVDKSVITTGATESSYLCLYAALFATANYQTVLAGGAQ